MDRKSKIFAPVRKIGGKSIGVKSNAQSEIIKLKKTLTSFKKDLRTAQLNGMSYKCGEDLVTHNNCKIEFIMGSGTKPVCFLVTGDAKQINEKKAFEKMPDDIQKAIETISKTNHKVE